MPANVNKILAVKASEPQKFSLQHLALKKPLLNFIVALRCVMLLVVIILITLGQPVSAANDRFLYVNNNSVPNQISGFIVNPDGTLAAIPGSPFPTGGSGGICFDIGSVTDIRNVGDFLYASNFGSRNVSGFHINNNGSLTPVPGSPFPASSLPIGLAASSDGEFLFVAVGFFGVDVYHINVNGSLTLVPGSPFVHFGSGFDMLYDQTRKNVISNINSNRVSVFDVAPNGTLTPIPGSPFLTPTNNNHKMALRPPGDDCLYVAGGGDPRASIMRVAPDGTLSNAPGSPILIGETVIGTTVRPQGDFVYFGSGSSSRIFGFTTDTTCQALPIAGSPFTSGGITPAGLTTDDTGDFLFAVHATSRNVSSLAIGANGTLTLVDTELLQGFASCPVGVVFTFPGKGKQIGPPATLELNPPTAINTLDTEHCVTATVRDASGTPVPDIVVRFQVTGAVNTSGSATTDQNGEATFCYQGPSLPGADLITAFADTNEDNTQDPDEPAGMATKTWVLPPTTPLCEIIITNGGWIIANNGDRANFGGNAKSDGDGNVSGEEEYQDKGPAERFNLHGNVTVIVCSNDSTQATIFGQATIDGVGSSTFRIDVRDLAEPGIGSDMYRMRVRAYDSGDQILRGGNIQIRRQ